MKLILGISGIEPYPKYPFNTQDSLLKLMVAVNRDMYRVEDQLLKAGKKWRGKLTTQVVEVFQLLQISKREKENYRQC